MNATAPLFEVEWDGDTLVVTPSGDLGELQGEAIEAEGRRLLGLLDAPGTRNLVLDFSRTDYLGSTALGLLFRLWARVRIRGGRVAACNLSEHEREILKAADCDRLWPLHGTRGEALRAVRGW